MKLGRVDFRTLPEQNALFLAYLYDFERVSSYYPPCPLSGDLLDGRVEKVLSARRFPRASLVSTLREYNDGVNTSEAVLGNLRKLESGDTVAVLTGQQVGLFGGPCFAAYKAATAIQTARYLEARGHSAVPVFWLASDDSDFEEVRSTSFFDREGHLVSLRHADSRRHERQMAGSVSLESGAVEELDRKLAGTDRREAVMQHLRESYRPGLAFRDAYARWLAGLFGNHGLLLFDPISGLKRLNVSDFLRVVLERRDDLVRTVVERNRQLEGSGFPAQVQVDESEGFMFWIDPPNRFKLEYQEGHYRAKGHRSLRFDKEELGRIVERHPGRITVNVLLRPILQEYLFPTFGAVVGPSELAYLGQVNALASAWGAEVAALPRAAFTIVDRKTRRLLKKYHLEVEQVLRLSSLQLAREVLKKGDSAGMLADLEAFREDVSQKVSLLKNGLERVDPPVAEMLERASRKILYQIEKVNRRFIASSQDRESTRERHLSFVRRHLLPRSRLQERILNFNSFLLTEGFDLVDQVLEAIDPCDVSHRVLYL